MENMIDHVADSGFEKERLKAARIDLARELSGMERIKFPGIEDRALSILEGEAAALEAAGYDLSRITPIKKLSEKLADGDMQVFATECVVLIVPAGCEENEIEANSIFPRHLRIVDGMDEKTERIGQNRPRDIFFVSLRYLIRLPDELYYDIFRSKF